MESISQKQRNFELFKRTIGYKSILKNSISYSKAANSAFTVADIIDSNIRGFSRFSHTTDLKKDQGYKQIKVSSRLPSKKVCRDLKNIYKSFYK